MCLHITTLMLYASTSQLPPVIYLVVLYLLIYGFCQYPVNVLFVSQIHVKHILHVGSRCFPLQEHYQEEVPARVLHFEYRLFSIYLSVLLFLVLFWCVFLIFLKLFIYKTYWFLWLCNLFGAFNFNLAILYWFCYFSDIFDFISQTFQAVK